MTNSRLVSSLAVFLIIKAVYAAGGDDWDWDYLDGKRGPSNWKWNCSKNDQSPIDISYSGAISDLDPLAPTLAGSCVSTDLYDVFTYSCNRTRTILTCSRCSTSDKPGMSWDYTGFNNCTAIGSVASKMFSLMRFHLHHPSEHKINNYTFDGEVHFVHEHSHGRRLVIGVFLEASGTTANSFMSGVLKKLPALISEQNLTDISQSQTVSNARESFIPVSGKWFNYQGSLTTPTCDEVADWWVSAEPVTISTAQLDEIHRAFLLNPRNKVGTNARPTQELNGREVRPIPTALSTTSAGGRQLLDLGSILLLFTSVFLDFQNLWN